MISTTYKNEIFVVSFKRAELDSETVARRLGNDLLDLCDRVEHQKLLIDFSGVKFLTSPLIGKLYLLHSKCQSMGIHLLVCNLSPNLADLLDRVRFTDVVAICEDEADARDVFETRESCPDREFGNEAVEFVMPARGGDAFAQYSLAQCYELARGVNQDFAKAFSWYEKAATAGHAAAQYELGRSYAFGVHVERDYDQAIRWFRAAATQGHAEAQYHLAMAYEFGVVDADSRESDYGSAAQWYERAAEQGHQAAQKALRAIRPK